MCCETTPNKRLRRLPTSLLKEIEGLHAEGVKTAIDNRETRRHSRSQSKVGDIVALRENGLAAEPLGSAVDRALVVTFHRKTLLRRKMTF